MEMEFAQLSELMQKRKDPDAGRTLAERMQVRLRGQGKAPS